MKYLDLNVMKVSTFECCSTCTRQYAQGNEDVCATGVGFNTSLGKPFSEYRLLACRRLLSSHVAYRYSHSVQYSFLHQLRHWAAPCGSQPLPMANLDVAEYAGQEAEDD